MRIEIFRMERMQSTFENTVEYNLSESGVHPLRVRDLIEDGRDAADLPSIELGYVQSNGTPELREKIARFYPGAGPDNVLVTNGGSEANYVTFWSLLEKGDRVACMLPNYLQTWGLSRAYAGGADPFRLVLRRDRATGETRWALDTDALNRAVGRRTKIILVTNPNNPTGGVLTGEEMDEVVRAARRSGAWIVADEIYRGAEVAGDTTPTFWGRYDRVIITSGLSKAFGLPGLRIGWIVAPPRRVETSWAYRDYTSIAPGTLSERLARVVMDPDRRDRILARTRSIIRANLPVLEEWARRRPEALSFCAPLAGAIMLLRYDLPIASNGLVERLRLERSVLIVSGDQLGIPKHIRIGFGSDADDLRAGLERIGGMIDELRAGRAVSGRRAGARPALRPLRPRAAGARRGAPPPGR